MLKETLQYQDKKITYFTKGDISDSAIVFIHGNSLCSKTFEAQFEQINNIPLIAIDLPGHGDSESALNPEKTYSIPGYVAVISSVLKKLNLKNYLLVGHSLGGHIALEAINELDSVKGLLIFGTPPFEIPLELEKIFLPNPAFSYLLQEKLSSKEVTSLANSISSVNFLNQIKNNIAITDGRVRKGLADSIGKGMYKNELEITKNLTIPIAILHGKNDAFINEKYLDKLTIPKLWKNTIQVIDGASHSPQMDNIEKFNTLLLEFYQFLSIVK